MHNAWIQSSETGAAFLARIRREVSAQTPPGVASRIVSLVQAQEHLRRAECLNLNAAENTTSPVARQLLDSDLATRLAEGPPGDRIFPPGRENACIDELEAIVIAQTQQLFHAEFVEWRPTSTTMANAVALFALTKSGDTLLVQSMEGGGNMSYHDGAIPSLRGLTVRDMPVATNAFEIDLDGVRRLARQVRPAMLIVGGSYVLFPYPVRELREIADDVGALLLYDAAHVALLVAAGCFQDPLAEGAHLMSMSTHKIMGGPVGGMLVTNDPAIALKLWRVPFPALMQTRDENKYAAAAYALTEMTEFGGAYARQMVANSQSLARALEAEGLPVIARDRSYSMTHQVFVDATSPGAREVEARCNAGNILLQASLMRGDAARGTRTGVRLSTQEITRQGLREAEMCEIAALVRRAALDRDPSTVIASDVARLIGRFPGMQFTFA